jgi:hypothetical protein
LIFQVAPGRYLRQMGAAMTAVAAAETIDRDARAPASGKPRHDFAFAAIDKGARRHDLAGFGQFVHVPVRRLRWPRMAAQAGADAAGSPRAAGIDI